MIVTNKIIKPPEMRNLADFLHNAFKDGGKLFCFGTVGGWFGGLFLVLGDTFGAWSVIVKIAVVLVSAAATGLATVAGRDFWVFKIRHKIFKNKTKEDERDDEKAA